MPVITSPSEPMPARSAGSPKIMDTSLYSSGHMPSLSAMTATTSVPAKDKKKKKKKKIVIPEHLATVDLEWLKAKQRESFEGMVVPVANPATSTSVEMCNVSGSAQETTSTGVDAAVLQRVETGDQLRRKTAELDMGGGPARAAHPAAATNTAAAAAEDLFISPLQAIEGTIEHSVSFIRSPTAHPLSESRPNNDPMDIDVTLTQASDPTDPQLAERETEFAGNVDATISNIPVGAEIDIVLAVNVIPTDAITPIKDIQIAPTSDPERAGLHAERSIETTGAVLGDKTMVLFSFLYLIFVLNNAQFLLGTS